MFPKRKMTFGVLEVFAREIVFSSTGPEGLIDRHDILQPPRILARADGPNTFMGCQSCQPLSIANIRKLSKRSNSIFMNDGPDHHSANGSKQRYIAREVRSVANVFYLDKMCKGHSLHTIITNAVGMGGERYTGDVHAITYTFSRVHTQNKAKDSLWKACLAAEIWHTPPDPSWHEHHKEIISRTLCRHICGIIDEAGGFEIDGWTVFEREGTDRMLGVLEALLTYCNGDWSLPKLQHHCIPGKCACKSEDICISKFQPPGQPKSRM